MPITYIIGDATTPAGNDNRIIVHCCNDLGYWNAGFVRSISRRWPEPELSYHRWAQDRGTLPFALGNVQFVRVAPRLCVANLIGQAGIRKRTTTLPPIRYEAIRKGLQRVREIALKHNASIHMPRMGAGLAGGKWFLIAEIIETELSKYGLQVVVYDPR